MRNCSLQKLLMTSNFSFSQCFLPVGELSAIFNKEIVVCKLFQFGKVSNLSFGKELKDGKLSKLGEHVENSVEIGLRVNCRMCCLVA